MSNLLLQRRVSPRMFIPQYAIAILVGGIIAGLLAQLRSSPLWYLIFPIPAIVLYGYAALVRAGGAYRLYEDRLEVEQGIFTRKIENVDLFRVRDVGLRQGMIARALDFGDVYVHSTDSSTPDLHVKGIDNPREFYDELRARISANRAQGRTMIVEESQAIPEG